MAKLYGGVRGLPYRIAEARAALIQVICALFIVAPSWRAAGQEGHELEDQGRFGDPGEVSANTGHDRQASDGSLNNEQARRSLRDFQAKRRRSPTDPRDPDQGEVMISGAPTADQIATRSRELANDNPRARQEAIRFLTTLGRDALPSVKKRFKALQLERPSPETVKRLLCRLQQPSSSDEKAGPVDRAGRVAALLEHRRDKAALLTMEPILLLASLETINTREAGLLIARLLTFDAGAWKGEVGRATARMGISMLPVLLEMRVHSNPAVSRWARRSIRLLGMQDPSVATSVQDSHLVAQVIRAYANPLDFRALPVITGFLDNDRIEIREAARWAMVRFKHNAIWQLREAYLKTTGRHAARSWGWERLAEELFIELDRPLNDKAEGLLAKGLSAYLAGDLQTMKRHFDHALVVYPDFERRFEMAPGYAALGDRRLAADDLQGAAGAYRRALRLWPRAREADKWRAQLAFVTAEQRLTRGVVDLDGYREALDYHPEHQAAAAALDRLGGAWLDRRRAARRWARIGAVVLLGLFACGLLYRKRRPGQQGAV